MAKIGLDKLADEVRLGLDESAPDELRGLRVPTEEEVEAAKDRRQKRLEELRDAGLLEGQMEVHRFNVREIRIEATPGGFEVNIYVGDWPRPFTHAYFDGEDSTPAKRARAHLQQRMEGGGGNGYTALMISREDFVVHQLGLSDKPKRLEAVRKAPWGLDF